MRQAAFVVLLLLLCPKRRGTLQVSFRDGLRSACSTLTSVVLNRQIARFWILTVSVSSPDARLDGRSKRRKVAAAAEGPRRRTAAPRLSVSLKPRSETNTLLDLYVNVYDSTNILGWCWLRVDQATGAWPVIGLVLHCDSMSMSMRIRVSMVMGMSTSMSMIVSI